MVSEKFFDVTVLAAIANTDWEGEITGYGSKVVIRLRPDIEINDYYIDQPLVVQRPGASKVELDIDKGKYFNTVEDDVIGKQTDVRLMDLWAESASDQMKVDIDAQVLRGIAADINADNAGVTAGRVSGDVDLGVTTNPVVIEARNPAAGNVEIIDLLVEMNQVLDEQNIPRTGRWFVLPSYVASMIKRSELRDASLTGDGESALRNGRLGMIDGSEIFQSNQLPAGVADGLAAGETQIFGGHRHGLTFASQMTTMETLRSEQTFGTLMRGLQVYGFKVVDGTALCTAVVSKP